jgi:hypothetical protein
MLISFNPGDSSGAEEKKLVKVKLEDLKDGMTVKKVKLAPGERFTVALQSNLATGADWFDPEFDKAAFRKIGHWSAGGGEATQPPPGSPDGYEVYEFEVIKMDPDASKLTFRHGQPFNPDSAKVLSLVALAK